MGDMEPARAVAVIVPARDFEVNGKAIEEEHVKGSEERDWDVGLLETGKAKL